MTYPYDPEAPRPPRSEDRDPPPREPAREPSRDSQREPRDSSRGSRGRRPRSADSAGGEGRPPRADGNRSDGNRGDSTRGDAPRSDSARGDAPRSESSRGESSRGGDRPRRGGRGNRSRRPRSDEDNGAPHDDRTDAPTPKTHVKQEMLINVSQPEECRIAIMENGQLEEFYMERTSADNYVGNIYKGRVVNIEPSIQAAFIDFGVGRNGFLHISDLEPQYFRQGGFDPEKPLDADNGGGVDWLDDDNDDDFDEGGSRPPARGPNRKQRVGARPRVKPPIQDVLRRGDELLVQVIKEGIGTKGPTLSTYISIPGRYLVLMPALGRVGVSRKIEDEQARRRLRDIMHELSPPKGLGFIVRTAGVDRSKQELSRDLAYLLRLWKVIVRRMKKHPAPIDIYEESDMIIRTIRDIFTGDVDAIHIDEPAAYERAKEFLQIVMPRYVNHLHLYEGKEPLFHRYGLDQEIARIHQRKVPLKQGGSIVIDQTEALVAIDVNSGNFRTDDSAEETAFQMNMAAAKEIARQLRLRDLGGVIVNDFIDMRREKHRRGVERALHDAMSRDRARTKILRTSPFGLIEMTRQRIRPSLKRSVYKDCECCTGLGVVKTAESMAIEAIRLLMLASQSDEIVRVSITVKDDVGTYLNNKKRREIAKIEDAGNLVVQVLSREGVSPEHCVVECFDAANREVRFTP